MIVLFADDDPDMVDIVSYSLRQDGHRVITAADGKQALELARRHQPDVAVLDVMMPELDGYEVCRRLRQESAMPIILLTARGEEDQKVWGLNVGADDYITKPFSHQELRARVRAVGRRLSWGGMRQEHGVLEAGPLRLDLDEHQVRLGDRTVDVTPKEFDLLHCLVLNADKLVTHAAILNFVWGSSFEGAAETVRVHIAHLRDKLGLGGAGAPVAIVNVRGVGYKLTVSG